MLARRKCNVEPIRLCACPASRRAGHTPGTDLCASGLSVAQEVDVCEDGRPLQEVWMVLEFCNRGTLSDAIQRGWLLSGARGAAGTHMAGGLAGCPCCCDPCEGRI